MKFINKNFFLLSALSLSCLNHSLLAGSPPVDFFLDNKLKDFIFLDDTPSLSQLTITNEGNEPLFHFFPYTENQSRLTLKSLKRKLRNAENPLLTLYQLWSDSFTDAKDELNRDPLHQLNYRGRPSQAASNKLFASLCRSLGIAAKKAYVRGKELFDFQVNDESYLLDSSTGLFYLNLNNEKMASSEEVLDDPFIALRAKHGKREEGFDFRDSYRQLASFDILLSEKENPESSAHSLKKNLLQEAASGIDLYPGESITFTEKESEKERLCLIEQTVDVEKRELASDFNFLSFYPIDKVTNNSNEALILDGTPLQPGESHLFEKPVFTFSYSLPTDSQTTNSQSYLLLSGSSSCALFPKLMKGKNRIRLGIRENKTKVHLQYTSQTGAAVDSMPAPLILNESPLFDHCAPQFAFDCKEAELIWWQIGYDENFSLVPSSLDQIEAAADSVTLSSIQETFLNPNRTYYFRLKSKKEGVWSDWSSSFAFQVAKPLAVTGVIFEETGEETYQLNWERYQEESVDPIEYWVFASNALDFVPSIYFDTQINAIAEDGAITEEEPCNNLIGVTAEPKIAIGTSFAYYRIIAKRQDQFSVPSEIIRVYDADLAQPRSVIQQGLSGFSAKRTLFPLAYPWSRRALPNTFSEAKYTSGAVKIANSLRSKTRNVRQYILPDLPESVWSEVRDYLLPDNHPAWPKLNRLFCKTRATLSPETFKKAGFRRWEPGRWSRVCASSHPEFPEYFIKAYCDVEQGILYDWRKWIHRIEGAETVRACIAKRKLGNHFKVPHKWIYPLPKNPAPPKSSKYLRKNFILVCENMFILDHSDNEHRYKHDLTPKLMNGIYQILQSCGLYDSVYVFNIPFCKDGKIAVIDTEYFGKWPVPFDKLTKYFPKDLQSYWKKLTYKGGKIPPGEPVYNPPRMDRRDIPPKQK